MRDFGSINYVGTDVDNTTTVHTGTVRYLAYELVKPYTPEQRGMDSDIHDLGCMCYEVGLI
jgi:serine/threonine protein kinase